MAKTSQYARSRPWMKILELHNRLNASEENLQRCKVDREMRGQEARGEDDRSQEPIISTTTDNDGTGKGSDSTFLTKWLLNTKQWISGMWWTVLRLLGLADDLQGQENADDVLKELEEERNKNRALRDEMKREQERLKAIENDFLQLNEEKDRIVSEAQGQEAKSESRAADLQNKLEEAKSDALQSKREANDMQSELERKAKALLDCNWNNNPRLDDLSDGNRPSKLAEQFSQLFNDEWLEAYGKLEDAEEATKIATLYSILEKARVCCEGLSKQQNEAIRSMALKLPGSSSNTHFVEIPPAKEKQLKELRKSFAVDVIDEVKQECYREVEAFIGDKEEVAQYFNRSVELFWLMGVQDPPVVLLEPQRPGDPFDKKLYKAYMTAGQVIDYVVWPVLLRYEDGDMLSKGYARGK